MDVANPSNFVRIMEIFEQQIPDLKTKLTAVSVDDDTTRSTLKRIFDEHQYLLDPHGAVGYTALENYLTDHPSLKGIVLETAHPVKFYNVVEPVIRTEVAIPETIQKQLKLDKMSTVIENKPEALKQFLLSL